MKWLSLTNLILDIGLILYIFHLQGRLDWHRNLLKNLLEEAPDTATYCYIRGMFNHD